MIFSYCINVVVNTGKVSDPEVTTGLLIATEVGTAISLSNLHGNNPCAG